MICNINHTVEPSHKTICKPIFWEGESIQIVIPTFPKKMNTILLLNQIPMSSTLCETTSTSTSGHIYLFGGYDADGNFLNDLWVLRVCKAQAVTSFFRFKNWSCISQGLYQLHSARTISFFQVGWPLMFCGGHRLSNPLENYIYIYAICQDEPDLVTDAEFAAWSRPARTPAFASECNCQ